MGRQIFRQEALNRLASPEQLDRPVRIVGSAGWLGLAAAAAAIVAAVVWAFATEAPEKVAGQGILMRAGGLLEIAAADEGRIVELLLRPGQTVARGDVVATIDQADLERQLRNAQASLAAAKSRYDDLARFYAESRDRRIAADEERLLTIAETQTLLQQRLRLLEEKQRSVAVLVERKSMVRDRLIEVEVQVSDTRERIAQLDDERMLIQLGQIEEESERDIELLDQRLEVEGFERDVERLSKLLAEREALQSPYDGQVVEVKVNAGDVIQPGTALATIVPLAGDGASDLFALLYLPPHEGKRVRAGMAVEIAPSAVQREEFGYMVGTVEAVAPLPATLEGMRRALQNDQLVQQLSGAGAPFEVTVALARDGQTPSGFKWSTSQGPDVDINAGMLFEGQVVVRYLRLASFVLPGIDRMLDGDGE